jgi:hypothetical protein
LAALVLSAGHINIQIELCSARVLALAARPLAPCFRCAPSPQVILMTDANELTNQASNSGSNPKLTMLACGLGFVILAALYIQIIGF